MALFSFRRRAPLAVVRDEAAPLAERALAHLPALYGLARHLCGDPSDAALPKAPFVREVFASQTGYVDSLGALKVGLAALHLGAGRQDKDDAVDHAVGIVCHKKRGDAVEGGEPLAEVHARDEAAADEAADDVLAAYVLAAEPPRPRSIVLDTIG